ncbi:MAG: hypothetical protein ABSE82_16250, partial [Nitrososphaerales archaeon]
SSYTTFQGHPALVATAIFIVSNSNTQNVSYAVVVDIKLIFDYSLHTNQVKSLKLRRCDRGLRGTKVRESKDPLP